jgi:hypothetical protein
MRTGRIGHAEDRGDALTRKISENLGGYPFHCAGWGCPLLNTAASSSNGAGKIFPGNRKTPAFGAFSDRGSP